MQKMIKTFLQNQKEPNTAFCTVQLQNWKKPLQSVHMAWLFLAQKWKKCLKKNHKSSEVIIRYGKKSKYNPVR